MSGNPDDERLDELREQKMQELREQAEGQGGGGEEAAQQAAQERADAQKEAMLKQYLTDGARQRLNAVQMSKPDFAEQVEQQIVALAQSGRIQDRIDEEQMKSLLKELKPDSKSFDIRRR
jgi:programmed cell death protein 5